MGQATVNEGEATAWNGYRNMDKQLRGAGENQVNLLREQEKENPFKNAKKRTLCTGRVREKQRSSCGPGLRLRRSIQSGGEQESGNKKKRASCPARRGFLKKSRLNSQE